VILISHSSSFQDGTRVLFLKGRYKDGIKKQRTITRITHNAEEHDTALRELSKLAEEGERIYGSAEPRCLKAAARYFKIAMIESDYVNDYKFWERIDRRWESALMQPTSRDPGYPKFWLFDCDNGEADELIRVIPAEQTPHYRYSTKNGEHVLTQGFDKRVLPPHLEKIRNDNPLMLWGY